MIESLIRNLSARDILDPDEIAQLQRVIGNERYVGLGEDIVAEGSRPMTSTLLVDGIAARYRVMEDGTRQITALHVAGDFVDLHAFMLKTMDHGVLALSRCQTAIADHKDLKLVTETQPHLARMLWLSTVIDGAIHREWITAMGGRSKKSHLAHLICELFTRLKVVGKVKGSSFHFPLSQAVVADVLGISLVHLNNTLQNLRRDEVIQWEDRVIAIQNWPELASIAEFDDVYLNLVNEPR